VIDHPIDKNKYLVHACLEGPEAGVYYRGKSKIVNNDFVKIILPDYVHLLATEFTIQITALGSHNSFYTSKIQKGKFKVYGKNGKFFWHVHGMRNSVQTEPDKNKVSLNGNGPYQWISKKSANK